VINHHAQNNMIHIEGEHSNGIDNKQGPPQLNMAPDRGPGVGDMVIKGGSSPEDAH